MKRISLIVLAVGLGLAASISFADTWGHGLGQEYKAITIPLNQQSGWDVQGLQTMKPAAKKAAPAKAAVQKQPAAVAQKPLDSDKDGVIDANDNCEGTASGIKVDAKGCPQEAKAIPEKDWTLQGIQFETGSDKIKAGSQASLDEAADMLKTHTRVVVEIQGHTDDSGSAEANQSLSERRAQAVRKYLADKGVQSTRMEAKGYGESKPIADNTTVDGRAKNRRIDFKVLSR